MEDGRGGVERWKMGGGVLRGGRWEGVVERWKMGGGVVERWKMGGGC